MQRRLVWIGVALATAAIVPVARPQPATDGGWLGVERWQLSFTLTRTRQQTMDSPGMGIVTGTVHQRTESSSAAGTLVLVPWSDAERGHRSWEGRDDVPGQYRATATSEAVLEEGGTFVHHLRTAGDERSGVSAALWIDVNAGTYTLHVDGSWVPIEETSWTEFPPDLEAEMREVCASELAIMFFMVCMALQQAEPVTEQRSGSLPSGLVEDEPLPGQGQTLTGSVAVDDTVFSWAAWPDEPQCVLVEYAGRNFTGRAVVAHRAFLPALERIDRHAQAHDVLVNVTHSFRAVDADVTGAIVTPARRSNHLAGHGIDMNVMHGSPRQNCNSTCMADHPNVPEPVRGFLEAVRDDALLRWGGDFTPIDTVHIDDGLNTRDPARWEQHFEAAQASHQAGCPGG